MYLRKNYVLHGLGVCAVLRSTSRDSRKQAGRYAAKLGMTSISIAVFVPVEDEDVLKKLSGHTVTDGVNVIVKALPPNRKFRG